MQQSVTCGSKNAKGVKKIVKKDDLFKLELDVDKLDIDELNELKSVPISLKCFKKCSLKKKCQLDVDTLKNVSVDLKKLSDVVEKEVVKKLYLTN